MVYWILIGFAVWALVSAFAWILRKISADSDESMEDMWRDK